VQGAQRYQNPVRLSLERVWLYSVCCAIVASLPFILLPWFHDVAYRYDFACFWSAGANAGTSVLTDPQRLYDWAHARGMIAQPFSYLPAFAWLYAPLSRLDPMHALIVEELGMTAVFAACGLVASRVYGFNPWFSVAAVLAWGPTVSAIEVGQNTGIALLLTFFLGWSLLHRRPALAGSAVGLLFYKPTLALPLLLLLLVRREWRALGVAALCCAGWYLASVAASGGDWRWPVAYVRLASWWLPMDFSVGAIKAFTVPTLLMAAGLKLTPAAIAGAAILLLSLPLAARAGAVAASSMMPLVGLAASPHAWPYEAALALPAVFYAVTRLPEPPRTSVVGLAYAVVAVGMIAPHGIVTLAVLCVGGTAVWLWAGYRPSPRPRVV